MVAVYCLRGDAFAQSLRDSFLAVGIPCVLVGPTHGPASVLQKVAFVLFAPSAIEYSEGVRRKLPEERITLLSGEENAESAVKEVERAYLRRFGVNYSCAREDGIRFDAGRVYYRGHYLPLTASEYRIVRFLVHCRKKYCFSEEIAAACLADPEGGVTVHICNINSKSRKITLYPLIECRRYSGYRIP